MCFRATLCCFFTSKMQKLEKCANENLFLDFIFEKKSLFLMSFILKSSIIAKNSKIFSVVKLLIFSSM